MYTRLVHASILSSFSRFFERWGAQDAVAVHGGAALHMFHDLQRRSSDMDFVIERNHLDLVLPAVRAAVTELQQWLDDKGLVAHVSGSGRTKGDGEVTRYKLAIGLDPGLIGSVHVHLEFWPVDRQCILNYEMHDDHVGATNSGWTFPVKFRAPGVVAAQADKVTALLARNHLKWRDIYDLWHLHRNCGGMELLPQVLKVLPQHLSAYQTMQPQEVVGKIVDFLEIDNATLVEMAKSDLLSYLDETQRAVVEQVGYAMLEDAVQTARGYFTALYFAMVTQVDMFPDELAQSRPAEGQWVGLRREGVEPGVMSRHASDARGDAGQPADSHPIARKVVPGMMLALMMVQNPAILSWGGPIFARADGYLELLRSFLA